MFLRLRCRAAIASLAHKGWLVLLLALGAAPSRSAERVDAFGDPLPPQAVRRIGSIHFRPGGGVRILLPCPDGKTLISDSAFGDRSVYVWDLATGRLLRQFPGSWQGRPLALSPDGKMLAIASDEDIIHLYDFASGRELRQLKGHRFGIIGLGFSPDGKVLASSAPEDIRLWDPATGAERAKLPVRLGGFGSPLLAFTPDGKTLLAGHGFNATVHVWDAATRRESRTLSRGNGMYPWSLALSPDGTTLAMGSGDGRGGGDGVIPLWDVAKGKVVRELHSGRKVVTVVSFSPDGKLLASVAGEGRTISTICLWDLTTGKPRYSWEGYASSLAFSRDGKTLLAGIVAIRRWDVATGKEIQPPQGNLYPVYQLALSPDGKTLATPSDEETLRLWEPATGKLLRCLRVEGEHLLRCAFSPDGRTLATTSDPSALRLWDAATGKQRRTLASASAGQEANPLGKGEYLTGIAYSSDGRTLATSSWPGAVRLWDARTGAPLHRFPWPQAPRVDAVTFSGNGSYVWAAAPTRPAVRQQGTEVRAWDASRGQELPQLTATMNARMAKLDPDRWSAPFAHLAVSRDGRMLAVNRAKTISVWETASGQERLLLKGQSEPTVCTAFSPDGRLFVSACRDGTFRLWDLATGTELARLSGHRGKVNALLFSPDGQRLYSGGEDTSILVSDVARITKNGLPAVARPTPTVWDDLADDAAVAYRAIHTLRADPAAALPLFRKHLRPAASIEEKRLAEVIRNLDAAEFARRESALQELEKLGEAAEPALRRALQGKSSLELHRRIDRLLEKLIVPGSETLRLLRAIEVLEHIGSDETRQLLHKLAEGSPEALPTREAKAALERLSRR